MQKVKLSSSKRISLAKKITDEKEMLDLYHDNFHAPRVQASLFDNPNLTDNVLSGIFSDLRASVGNKDISKTTTSTQIGLKSIPFLSSEAGRIMYLIDAISTKPWLSKSRVMQVLDISNTLTFKLPKKAFVPGTANVSFLGVCTYFHIVIYNDVLSDLEKIDLIKDITSGKVALDPLKDEMQFRDYLDTDKPDAPGPGVVAVTGLKKNNDKYKQRQSLIVDQYNQSSITRKKIKENIVKRKRENSPFCDQDCDKVLEAFH